MSFSLAKTVAQAAIEHAVREGDYLSNAEDAQAVGVALVTAAVQVRFQASKRRVVLTFEVPPDDDDEGDDDEPGD